VGRLPYIERKNGLGIPWGISTHWSHLGGPIISQSLSDEVKSDVLRQLIAQLSRKTSFHFVCSSHANDANLIRQAFTNAGFMYSRQITYSLHPEESDLMSRLSSKPRSHIRSAERDLEVMEIGAGEFTSIYETNLKASGLKSYAPLNVARELISKGREGDAPQVRVIAARKRKAGLPYDAAVATAWDKERYYLWMMTRRRPFNKSLDKPHGDAIKLLILRAAKHAQSLGLTFDVDGAPTPGHEKLYREILKVPNMEYRDVFDRATGLARLFEICRPRIKKAAAF
jgi:hypothetical protein